MSGSIGFARMTSRPVKLTLLLLLCLQLCWQVPSAAGQDRSESPGGNAPARLRPVLAASAFLLGSAAVVLELESDRDYQRYLDTADPRRMSSSYDAAERKRDLSTAALVGAELCAVALLTTYLIQKRPAEPEPGTVIIGLVSAPGWIAVRVGW